MAGMAAVVFTAIMVTMTVNAIRTGENPALIAVCVIVTLAGAFNMVFAVKKTLAERKAQRENEAREQAEAAEREADRAARIARKQELMRAMAELEELEALERENSQEPQEEEQKYEER